MESVIDGVISVLMVWAIILPMRMMADKGMERRQEHRRNGGRVTVRVWLWSCWEMLAWVASVWTVLVVLLIRAVV